MDAVEALNAEEPFFHASFHPALGKEFEFSRSWYGRHVKQLWKPSTVTGELGELLGIEKWGDRTEHARKPQKRQALQAIAAQCTQCGTEFPSRSKMFKHIREEHPQTQTK